MAGKKTAKKKPAKMKKPLLLRGLDDSKFFDLFADLLMEMKATLIQRGATKEKIREKQGQLLGVFLATVLTAHPEMVRVVVQILNANLTESEIKEAFLAQTLDE